MSLINPNKISEKELIEGCKLGDRRLQELMYQTFAPRMFSICLRYSGDKDIAKDILQEGFIKAFGKLDSYNAGGSFEGWLKKIFIRTAIDHYNKTQFANPTSEIEESLPNEMDVSVLEEIAANEVLALVQKLPENYQTVFNLSVIEGYTHKDIAELLGISEGTSKAQLAKAKAILQTLIKRDKD
jgi:RNA polymerase sigma factor (sigma-70 family)